MLEQIDKIPYKLIYSFDLGNYGNIVTIIK